MKLAFVADASIVCDSEDVDAKIRELSGLQRARGKGKRAPVRQEGLRGYFIWRMDLESG